LVLHRAAAFVQKILNGAAGVLAGEFQQNWKWSSTRDRRALDLTIPIDPRPADEVIE